MRKMQQIKGKGGVRSMKVEDKNAEFNAVIDMLYYQLGLSKDKIIQFLGCCLVKSKKMNTIKRRVEETVEKLQDMRKYNDEDYDEDEDDEYEEDDYLP